MALSSKAAQAPCNQPGPTSVGPPENLMTIRENLLVLIEAVKSEPEKLFDLSVYERKNSCGTLHCTLGLAATLTHFRMQGLEISASTVAVPVIGGTLVYDVGAYDKLDQLFGKESCGRLFGAKHEGEWDFDLQAEQLTDKQLALARLDKQLELYP